MIAKKEIKEEKAGIFRQQAISAIRGSSEQSMRNRIKR